MVDWSFQLWILWKHTFIRIPNIDLKSSYSMYYLIWIRFFAWSWDTFGITVVEDTLPCWSQSCLEMVISCPFWCSLQFPVVEHWKKVETILICSVTWKQFDEPWFWQYMFQFPTIRHYKLFLFWMCHDILYKTNLIC